MKEISVITQSDTETRHIAEEFARELCAESNTNHVVSLEGELGAGKTTFMQGVGKGLGIKQQMTSPTFIIFRVFDLPRGTWRAKRALRPLRGLKNCAYKRLYHFDCYRLKSYEDLRALDFEDIIADPKNLVIIEWGDMIKEHLPKGYLQIVFETMDRDKRRIRINS